MARTTMQDPNSGEARSAWIAGLTEICNKLCGVLNMKTSTFTDLTMVDSDDRRRYYDAPLGNKLWLETPAPVIKKNGAVITPESDHFEIDYLGGGVIFEDGNALDVGDELTASATYIIDESNVITDLVSNVSTLMANKNKMVGLFDYAYESSGSGTNRGTYLSDQTGESGNFAIVTKPFENNGLPAIFYWDAATSAWAMIGRDVDLSGYVPITRTVNGKSLSNDVNLNAADVNAVPTTRKVNNKALSSDIALNAADVGAATPAQVTAAHNTANSAYAQANAAFNKANSAATSASSAATTASSAYTKANNAHNAANTAATTAGSAYTQANNAYNRANSAYAQANNAYNRGNAAYNQANNAYNAANAASTTASSAYNKANSAASTASSAYIKANTAHNTANSAYAVANRTSHVLCNNAGTVPSVALGRAIAIGNRSVANAASSTNGIAVAIFANASASSASTANATATSVNAYAIAIGANANASSYAASASNANANAASDVRSTIAIGHNINAYANAYAIGANATASASSYNTFAIGCDINAGSYAAASASTANATAYTKAIAIGCGINASTNAIGHTANARASANNIYAIAIGHAPNVSATAYASGYNVSANNIYAIAIGSSANVSATAYGGGNATAIGAIAIGGGANVSAYSSLNGYNVSTSYAIAIGHTANVSVHAGPYDSANVNTSTAIAIGSYTEAKYFGAIAIGGYAKANSANTMQLGNASSLSKLSCRVSLTVTSDERDKTDIEDIDSATEFLRKIRTVRYVLNEREKYKGEEYEETIVDEDGNEHTERKEREIPESDRAVTRCFAYNKTEHAKGTKKGKRVRAGVLAQNVQQAMEEVYGSASYAKLVDDDCFDYPDVADNVEHALSISYEDFVPFLIKSVQELDERLTAVETLV